jgi:hypothetical protein
MSAAPRAAYVLPFGCDGENGGRPNLQTPQLPERRHRYPPRVAMAQRGCLRTLVTAEW